MVQLNIKTVIDKCNGLYTLQNYFVVLSLICENVNISK